MGWSVAVVEGGDVGGVERCRDMIMGTGLGEGVGSRVVGILSLFNVLEDVTIEDTAAVVDSGCKDDADEAFSH